MAKGDGKSLDDIFKNLDLEKGTVPLCITTCIHYKPRSGSGSKGKGQRQAQNEGVCIAKGEREKCFTNNPCIWPLSRTERR